MADVIN